MASVALGVLATVAGVVAFVSVNAWLGVFLVILGFAALVSGLRGPQRRALR